MSNLRARYFGQCAMALVLAWMGLAGNASATVITPAGVTCTGSWASNPFPGAGPYGCGGLIDGVTNDSVLGPTANASYWLGRDATLNETFTVDLGGNFLVTSIDLYNTHNGLNPTANDRSTDSFKIWISADPVTPTNPPAAFGLQVLSGSLAFFASTNPNPEQSFDIADTVGRYVTFRAETYQGTNGPNGAGLSEIVVNTPEPATLALLGLGLAGLRFSRRKRAG